MSRLHARIAVAVIVLLLGGGLAAAGDARGPACNPSPHLEGTWLVRVEWPGYPPFQYLHQFLPGGKASFFLSFGAPECTKLDPTNPLYGGTPESWYDTRVGCMGDWTPRGTRRFDVTMYCLPHQGDGYVPDRIRMKVTLSRDGQAFAAPGFNYAWFNPDGSVSFEGAGNRTGTRLAHVPQP
jgi:hypothetical protein